MHRILSKVTIPELVWAQDPILGFFFPTVFSLIMFPKINVEKPWFNLSLLSDFFLITVFFFQSPCLDLSCDRCMPPQQVTQRPGALDFLKVMRKVSEELSQSSVQGAAVSRWLRLPFPEKGKPSLGRLEIAHIISTREIHISAHL